MLRSFVQSRLSIFADDEAVNSSSQALDKNNSNKENLLASSLPLAVPTLTRQQQQPLAPSTRLVSPSVTRPPPSPNVVKPRKSVCSVPAPAPEKPADSRAPFTIQDFDIGRQIGRGSTSLVYVVKAKTTGKLMAIKTVYKSRLQHTSTAYSQLQREIEIHTKFKHPNICRMFSYFHDETKVYLLLEHCPGGSLLQELERNGPFSEQSAARVVRSIASALATLHRFQVAHRDVKTENILFAMAEGGRSKQVKLADFGCAVANLERGCAMRQHTICGTEEYWAPELVEGVAYDERVDDWALGVVMFELLMGAGRTPFAHEDVTQIFDRIVSLELDFPSLLPEQGEHCCQLLASLLQRDARKRMRARDVEQHMWIADHALRELV